MTDPFVPSTRYANLFREQHPEDDLDAVLGGLLEHEITSGCEDVEALTSGCEDVEAYGDGGPSWKQFATAAGRGLVWLSPRVFVTAEDSSFGERVGYSKQFMVGPSTKSFQVWALSSGSTARQDIDRECSIIFRLLETSGFTHAFIGQTIGAEYPCVISGPTLLRFLTGCKSLVDFTVSSCLLCEPHVRALSDAVSVRPDLKYSLAYPRLTPEGKAALSLSLKQSWGPAHISTFQLECRFFADAISGNTRLAQLWLRSFNADNSDENIAAFVQALSLDKGLQELQLASVPLRNDNWRLLMKVLTKHLTLQTLIFEQTGFRGGDQSWRYKYENQLSEGTKLFRAETLAEMLQTNTVLTSVDLNFRHPLIATEIEPRLRANRLRLKAKAITKAPVSWRRQLAGRALDAVSFDPTLQFGLLVQNADVLFSNDTRGKRDRPHSGAAAGGASKRVCAGTD